jgi:hypothetical protein
MVSPEVLVTFLLKSRTKWPASRQLLRPAVGLAKDLRKRS